MRSSRVERMSEAIGGGNGISELQESNVGYKVH